MMKIDWPESGTYIVAVSGGVDSVCLLDMLVAHGGYDLVVAHVDHGIREDSGEDAKLVKDLTGQYRIPGLSKRLNVKKASSEEQLRTARYNFLFEAMKQVGANAILTAHHADDLLETSIMNVRRGTDRYGAAGGMTREGIIRPLISVTKEELLDYAKDHKLEWHEDNTNLDVKYTRNKIRHEVIPSIDKNQYQKHLQELGELNAKIDSELKSLVLVLNEGITIPRAHLNGLSLREVEVLLAYALRQACPNIELNQRRVAEVARQIMLGTHKISFSISATDCIIIDIP